MNNLGEASFLSKADMDTWLASLEKEVNLIGSRYNIPFLFQNLKMEKDYNNLKITLLFAGMSGNRSSEKAVDEVIRLFNPA